ncbi:hypothetical protein ACUIJ5_30675 (plasmid) [Bacillus toyonensis]
MQPVWKKGFLKEFLLSLKGVKYLQIATAYISNYGLEILIDVIEKNHLKKDQVEIYIGATFSTTDTISILEDLQMRCTTSIVTKETLHAKVYFATCQDGSHHLFYRFFKFNSRRKPSKLRIKYGVTCERANGSNGYFFQSL